MRNHEKFAAAAWSVADDGRVKVTNEADSITLARLAQFAERDDEGWKITAASVGRGRDRGLSAENMLGWLKEHQIAELPPVMETAIRNWRNPARVFVGELVMLRVPQPRRGLPLRRVTDSLPC